MGERRRVATWEALLGRSGLEVISIPLLSEHRLRVPRPREASRLARGLTVPEALAWSVDGVRRRVEQLRPRLLICVTGRAYHPALVGLGGCSAVLDFVDSLARSYRDRAGISAGWRRHGFALLAGSHRRFEAGTAHPPLLRVAAGWRDARELGADWLPILAPEAVPADPAGADRDVIFFGNLSYPPNVEAVQRLSRIWPALLRRRPGTTAMLAGAAPATEVRRLAGLHGWELVADFRDLGETCGRARIAVAPLDHTAGIQIKVLEAAAMGLAQVVTPEALDGMAPGFPAIVGANDAGLIDGIVRLLDDERTRVEQAEACRRHVKEQYSVTRWTPWTAALLAPTAA
jgi:hypothetical protein